MADARDLTYGVGFQASDALNAIEQMESGLGDVDEAVDRAEAGAQSCSRAISDMGAAGADAARDAGAAAQRMGADFDDAGDNASDSFRKWERRPTASARPSRRRWQRASRADSRLPRASAPASPGPSPIRKTIHRLQERRHEGRKGHRNGLYPSHTDHKGETCSSPQWGRRRSRRRRGRGQGRRAGAR